jgi:hypothetical protein
LPCRITRLDLSETRIGSIHSGLDYYTHLLLLNISHRYYQLPIEEIWGRNRDNVVIVKEKKRNKVL